MTAERKKPITREKRYTPNSVMTTLARELGLSLAPPFSWMLERDSRTKFMLNDGNSLGYVIICSVATSDGQQTQWKDAAKALRDDQVSELMSGQLRDKLRCVRVSRL